ncbi:hypothetical protein CDA63_19410, partial [Hymenobacter amundsenii]
RGLTPHEFVCAQWQKNPVNFTHDPTHLTLGLYSYPSQTVGQTGWAYSVYLLARFGEQPHPVSFYAAHYQRAFPFVLAEFTDPAYRTPLEQLTYCYGVRTFERGLNWFGLLGSESQVPVLHQPDQSLTASPLLAQLFAVQQGPV